jgi:hypothetical protein
MTNEVAPSGWYQDPTGQGDGRYWNGTSWTESVDRGGVTVNVAIDPSQAQVPPTAGTEISIPASTPAAQTVPARRSPVGAILGLVFLVVAIVLIVVLVNNNDDSSNDGPPTTDVAPATEAPAPPDTGGG